MLRMSQVEPLLGGGQRWWKQNSGSGRISNIKTRVWCETSRISSFWRILEMTESKTRIPAYSFVGKPRFRVRRPSFPVLGNILKWAKKGWKCVLRPFFLLWCWCAKPHSTHSKRIRERSVPPITLLKNLRAFRSSHHPPKPCASVPFLPAPSWKKASASFLPSPS